MTKTIAPAWALDESLYTFPVNAIRIGEHFTATDDSRPVLSCLYCVARDGKLTVAAADGFSAAIMTTKINRSPYDKEAPEPDVEFFLHREQLVVLGKMPFGKGTVGDPVLAVNASGQVRVGSPKMAMWANEASVSGTFPDVASIVPTVTGKIEALTMGVPVMTKFLRFANKVHGEWIEFRQDAKGPTGPVTVAMRSVMDEVEDYSILLMPMVRSM